MRILIIENEILLAREINRFLQKQGFKCKEAHTGKSALEYIHSQIFNLILLDSKLPDYEGLDLMEKMLALRNNLAVIILSAQSTTEDRIDGLNRGADDYLPKPFSLLELKTRILTVIRRKNNISGNILRAENIELDLFTRNVTCGEGLIRLTRKEYDILIFLMLNKNKVVSRFQLVESIWGDALGMDYNSNFIDVHIKNLRKKLSCHTTEDFLETIRGIGFRLNEINQENQ